MRWWIAGTPDVFRFDSTRFIGGLRAPSDPPNGFESVSFEVQIRSAFEHAWSSTTHALVYKNDVTDWRRLRLAAQLKAAVEQLDMLIVSFDGAATGIDKSVWYETSAQQQVQERFAELFQSGFLPAEIRPKSLGKFAENVVSAMLACTVGRGAKDRHAKWQTSFGQLNEHISALPKKRIPLSISLFQFVLAEAATIKLVQPTIDLHYPITPEVVDLYPGLKGWRPVFDLSG